MDFFSANFLVAKLKEGDESPLDPDISISEPGFFWVSCDENEEPLGDTLNGPFPSKRGAVLDAIHEMVLNREL